MLPVSKYEVRLWTTIGLLHTSWEIIRTNDEDVQKMWENMKNFREYVHFAFFCNFCTIRLYLLAYIALVYPVFVEKYKMLITPWLVISGLRVLAPNIGFRIYFWILIFRYWMHLIDKEIRKCLRDATTEKKRKYLQRLDKDEEALIKETRRRIKGIRCHIARKRLFESSTRSLTSNRMHVESTSGQNTPFENVSLQDVRFLSSEFGIISGEYPYRDSFETENRFFKIYNHSWRASKVEKQSPVRATDCILQQITDLIQTLVSKPKDQLLNESLEAEKEIDLKRNAYSKNQTITYMLHSDEVISSTLQYKKPRYLSDYPGIFAKDINKSSKYNEGQKASKFGRMLMKTSHSDDTLRETFEEFYGRT